MRTRRWVGGLIFSACGGAACGADLTPGSDRPPLKVAVTHGAASPLARTKGSVAFATSELAIAATATGIVVLQTMGAMVGQPAEGFSEWVMTSTGSGSTPVAGTPATAISVAPDPALIAPTDGPIDRHAFFLPAGRPQLGAARLHPRAASASPGSLGSPGSLAPSIEMAILHEPLGGPYPSGLIAPWTGPGADGLWISDAALGSPNAVRFYPYAGWHGLHELLAEDSSRRFQPAPRDFDGDGASDTVVLGRLAVLDEGRVGMVTCTFAGIAPTDASGCVVFFDPETGEEIGHLTIPLMSRGAGALGFVQSASATTDHLIVVAAVKGPTFEDLGGEIAIYRVRSWRPLRIDDSDSSASGHQPDHMLKTTVPNPVGVTAVENLALVVDAPFDGEGALDIVQVSERPFVRESLPLGSLYVDRMNLPGDPVISPDQTQALIGTESGLLRVTLSRESRE